MEIDGRSLPAPDLLVLTGGPAVGSIAANVASVRVRPQLF